MLNDDLRTYLNSLTGYKAKLRDKYIDYQGITVNIDRPNTEDQIDDFGDIIQGARTTSQIKVVPRYDAYHMIIDLFGGVDIEQELPLELEARTADYIPNDSLIYLPINSPDDLGAPIEPWRVIRSEIKYLERMHVRIIKVVPFRDRAV